MSAITGLLAGIAALLVTALAGIAFGRRAAGRLLVYGTSLLLCSAMAALALVHLLDPAAAPSTAWLPLGLPWQGALFRLDALSAFFAFVVGLGGAAASLFALGYGRHEHAPGRVLPFYPLFLAGMNLVVLADDAFSFLLSWEFMSLSSWALVMAHHQERDNARAGYVYLVMASFGTLALLLCFGLLASAGGDYTFDAMRAAAHGPATMLPVLALALLGAGSKAGIVPLHAWLPLAHPAAPSHVSALMSGVMTKVAVYGFIRIAFELSGEPQWWSGFLVLLAGGATAVLGVLYALMQHDLKR
ncbi:MAG TPA: proton-conducting transporter membrane subunit, partial [Steroidobacteraceae bacterium]